MERPQIVTREEWLSARRQLLIEEKASTRARDALNARRRQLPMVEVDAPYAFDGVQGPVGLGELFAGRRQLIVYHFMWLDETDEGCASCALLVDSIGELGHLQSADTSLVLVSRAPLEAIERFRRRMGWTVPWYSSAGSSFNYDFHVTADESVAPIQYNYKDKAALQRDGLGHLTNAGQDGQGISVFLRDGGRIFHTYSSYGRGVDVLIGTYNYLDLTPLGRQRYVDEFPHHDAYEGFQAHSCH